jgi:hypothetical protein
LREWYDGRQATMTITLDLDVSTEEKLRAQAAARGVPVEEYLADVVREAANGTAGTLTGDASQPAIDEFEADWAAFAEGLDHVLPLAPDAFSREAMYSDHD